jgi:hypothetical protein
MPCRAVNDQPAPIVHPPPPDVGDVGLSRAVDPDPSMNVVVAPASVLSQASALMGADRHAEALALLAELCRRPPEEIGLTPPQAAEARHLRGLIYVTRIGDLRQGTLEWEAALALDPGNVAYRVNLIKVYRDYSLFDQTRVAELTPPLLDSTDPAFARLAYESLIFARLCEPSPSTDDYRDLVYAWGRRFVDPHCVPRPHASPRPEIRPRLRFGFVHNHYDRAQYVPILAPLFEELRRLGHYVVGVSTIDNMSALSERMRGSADSWLDVRHRDDRHAAAAIAELGLDVLVNLDGFSTATRFDLFMRRPARLLVSWHNTHYTFGSRLFDCVVTDAVVSARERSEYAERILDLPGCYFAIEPLKDAPEVTPPPVQRTGFVTFGCLNRPDKIGDATAEAWSRILEAVPNSRLYLRNIRYDVPHIVNATRQRLYRAGIAPERLRFGGGADSYAFLSTYGEIDIALDPFPFTGGITTYQALWQGVPVPAFPGQRWASRVSVSILKACGLADLVAESQPAYEALVVALAQDGPRLAELRRTLRSRVAASPFTDTRGFATTFAAALAGVLADTVAPSAEAHDRRPA